MPRRKKSVSEKLDVNPCQGTEKSCIWSRGDPLQFLRCSYGVVSSASRYVQTEHAICSIFLKGSKIYFKNRFCIKLHTQRKNSIIWHLLLNLPLLLCCSLPAISVSHCLWRRILWFLSCGACNATSWAPMTIDSQFPRLGWNNRGLIVSSHPGSVHRHPACSPDEDFSFQGQSICGEIDLYLVMCL